MLTGRLVALGLAVLTTTALATPVAPTAASAQAVAPCSSALPCHLTAGLSADVSDAQVSPDSRWAVVTNRDSSGAPQLYSMPVAGGAAPVKLNVTARARLRGISPDSTRVLYSGPPASGGADALFSVPIDGPAAGSVRLLPDVTPNAPGVKISPDGRKVVAEQTALDRLFAVPIEGPGTSAVRLTDRFVTNGAVHAFEISPDSRSVVYTADQDTDDVAELYRVPLSLVENPDPPTTKLSGPLVAGGDVRQFAIAPGAANRVVYQADQEISGKRELYSVRLGGAERAKISRPLPADWDVFARVTSTHGFEFGWSIDPSGSRVVYRTTGIVEGGMPAPNQLHSVPIAGPGTAGVRLDQPLGSSSFEHIFHRSSPDGARVVYTVPVDGLDRSYSVPIAGPAGASVLVTWPSNTASVLQITPDSNDVVWHMDVGPAGGDDRAVFRSPIRGPFENTIEISRSELPSTPVRVTSTGTRALYAADSGGRSDIYSAPTSGSGTRYNLTGSLEPAIVVFGGLLTPDGQRVLYIVHFGPTTTPGRLYSSPVVPN